MPRKCTICGHKKRSAIDKALVERQPFRTIIDMEAWRETPGDDLVFAMMMPIWFGEKKLGSIFHPPPLPRAPVEARQPTLDELLKLQPNPDSDEIPRI